MNIYLSEKSKIVMVIGATIEKMKFGSKFNGEHSPSDKNIVFNLNLELDGEESGVALLGYQNENYMSFPPKKMIEDSSVFVRDLVGKRILINSSEDESYGNKIYNIMDFDVNASLNLRFNKILDPKIIGFRVEDYPAHEVLKMLGMEIGKNNRIRIKIKNDTLERIFLVNEYNYVISEADEPNNYLLTTSNISIIFDKYYKDNKWEMKIIPGQDSYGSNYSPDQSYNYHITSKGILESYKRYDKRNGKIIRSSNEYSLIIGQILPDSIAIFLEESGFPKGYCENNNELLITQ